jgi:hypothetical protein
MNHLSDLLRNLTPMRLGSQWYFALCHHDTPFPKQPFLVLREAQHCTVIFDAAQRAQWKTIEISEPMACIQLGVASALHDVGLTAAVSQALAAENISCNVIAAYQHDYLFVPAAQVERALTTLLGLSQAASEHVSRAVSGGTP